MKTLGKLNINSEKLMKNEELVTLRGGYGGTGYLKCIAPTYECTYEVDRCDSEYTHLLCNVICRDWYASICVGGES